VRDRALAIQQHADLAAEIVRELGELARELVREEAVGGKAAPVEALERVDLGGLETLGVSEDLDGSLSRARRLAVASRRAG
jgi:hypothetical protein